MVSCWKEHYANPLEIMLRLRRARKEEREAYARGMEILSMFELDKKASSMPLSLPFRERKFVGIARALATNPELLLLDEPAGGLSVEEVKELSRVILKLHEQGITIIFIEHRMEMVNEISHRVIVLNYGRKIAEGSFDEIKGNQEVISAYLG